MKYGFSLLQNLTGYYNQASFEVKQKMIGSIFPERLIYVDNNYRTNQINAFVSIFCGKSGSYEASSTKKTTHVRGLSTLAPEAGLEPATL
ncbi:hypothetical protein IC229_30275 [Spirosoma sp. BT702]|uniref:Uncharacterized protein n=1 Tax=Spirosoma profusum TaxID=2771354 RepID=A0A927AV44_9BACT|nr:hypothetical protein [Spirosoma profusum]MBD2704956.1 hypothetical protein [Spirosoma profusum]